MVCCILHPADTNHLTGVVMPYSIIVCEDNHELGRFYKKLLDHENYLVTTCATSVEFELVYNKR
jgi:hypothetical protein